jgi:hypothetical protein
VQAGHGLALADAVVLCGCHGVPPDGRPGGRRAFLIVAGAWLLSIELLFPVGVDPVTGGTA